MSTGMIAMAKARKLKSGNWNIQVFDYRDESGKRHYTSITRPTKLQCEYAAKRYQYEHPQRTEPQSLTVGAAIDRYIELCGVQSPTTVLGYKRIRKNTFQDLMQVPVKNLTDEKVQAAINRESKRISERTGQPVSAKTVHNAWGLISAALKKVCGKSFDVTMPKVKKDRKQYPDPKTVLDAVMDCKAKLPCLMSVWCTFSMSAILGIKCSSIKDGYLYIDQVRIMTEDGWQEKAIAKNATRNRVQRLPEYILSMIKESESYQRYISTGEDGYLFPVARDQIYRAWKKAAEKYGLDLTFHDLRHMSASIMLQLNIPEKYAQERGGWATSSVMKTVYQHTFSSERMAVDDVINDYFSKSLNGLSERGEVKR